MIVSSLARPARTALLAFALAVSATTGHAQTPEPSANAVALAKEIITLKATTAGFDAIGPSVVEKAKAVFLQTNPMLGKDLNEVAAKLRTEYASRFAEPLNTTAKTYASKFTEQELKEILAFYKSPAGKKVVVQEPEILQQSMAVVDKWASDLSEEIIIKMRAEMKKRGHDI
jgi:uncharacterized protein